MKMRYVILGLFVLLAVASCKKKETEERVPINFEMQLSASDTLEVRQLVDTYMKFVVNHEYADAVAMLYEIPGNNSGKAPELLDNDRITETMSALRSLPIKDYSIKKLTFKEAYKNEVRCGVTLDSDIEINWSFKPVRYLGKWYLCVRDTTEGDSTL